MEPLLFITLFDDRSVVEINDVETHVNEVTQDIHFKTGTVLQHRKNKVIKEKECERMWTKFKENQILM